MQFDNQIGLCARGDRIDSGDWIVVLRFQI
jgi:hypothetical protein